jgi:alcohol dehydrogenase
MALQEEVYGFFIPSVTLMGVGSHKEIGDQIKALGSKKPFICTDQAIVEAGISNQILSQIQKKCGIDAIVYEGSNSTNTNVHKGLEIYQQHKCDMIISLGSSSAHDCGKAIGVVATNGGNIRDYADANKSIEAMPAFIAFMIRPLALGGEDRNGSQ